MSKTRDGDAAVMAGQERLTDTPEEPSMRLLRIPVEAIEIRHNPRREADVGKIRELAASIAAIGQIQPLAVADLGGGRYELLAGGRRLEALRELGRDSAECVVLAEDGSYLRRIRALCENTAREQMSPLDEARELGRLGEELGLEVSELGEACGISPRVVRARLELLGLPKAAQQELRAGRIGLRAAARIAAIGEVSPGLGAEVSERIADGRLEARAFERDEGVAVSEVAASEARGCFIVPFDEGTRLEVGETAARLSADPSFEPDGGVEAGLLRLRGDGRLVEVSAVDVVRARAWGGLYEDHRDRYSSTAYMTDPAFIADWLMDELEERAVDTSTPAATAKEPVPEADAAAERLRRREERERAHHTNAEIGRRLALRYEYPEEISREGAEMIAALLLDAYGPELSHGLRLVREKWRRREVREMRGAGVRITERMPEPDEARELLTRELGEARDARQLFGRLQAGVMAALCADQRVLGPSQRRSFELPHAIGREQGIYGGALRAAISEASEICSESRYREIADRLGAELELEPVRERRSPRQIEADAAASGEGSADERERPGEPASLLDPVAEPAPEVALMAFPGGTRTESEEEK